MTTSTLPNPATSLTTITTAEAILETAIWPALRATEYATLERVLESFTRHKVGEEHFYSVTGYGHNDLGRDVTDAVFAHALQAPAALVRTQFASGTHAIAVALRGLTRPGDSIVSVTGTPYDTLESVLGVPLTTSQVTPDNPFLPEAGSLAANGVAFHITDCWQPLLGLSNTPISPADEHHLKNATVLYLQRSRGYSNRDVITGAQLQALIAALKQMNPTALIFVDNCYGEFTEVQEPTAYGADCMAGSLIKNPGGGIAPTGGYIAGRADVIAACANALFAPGIGTEGGYTFGLTRTVLQGLFLAPHVVSQALQGMTLAAHVFEQLGCTSTPRWDAPRNDIIQALTLGSAEAMISFCQTIQRVSPVQSYVVPVPSPVPGYSDSLIMAGGTFVDGSTMELSADGPLRAPYTVYLQGGLHYAHCRLAVQQLITALQ